MASKRTTENIQGCGELQTLRRWDITTHLLNFRIEADKFILNLPSHSNGVTFTPLILAVMEMSKLIEHLRGEYIEACFAAQVSHIRQADVEPFSWQHVQSQLPRKTKYVDPDQATDSFCNQTMALDSHDVRRSNVRVTQRPFSEPYEHWADKVQVQNTSSLSVFSPIRPNRMVDSQLNQTTRSSSPSQNDHRHSTPSVSPSLLARKTRTKKTIKNECYK